MESERRAEMMKIVKNQDLLTTMMSDWDAYQTGISLQLLPLYLLSQCLMVDRDGRLVIDTPMWPRTRHDKPPSQIKIMPLNQTLC